jgi:hypothetical protein
VRKLTSEKNSNSEYSIFNILVSKIKIASKFHRHKYYKKLTSEKNSNNNYDVFGILVRKINNT